MEKKTPHTSATDKIRLTKGDGTPMPLTPRPTSAKDTHLFVYEDAACSIQAVTMPGYEYIIVEYTVMAITDTVIHAASDEAVLLYFIPVEGNLTGYSDNGVPSAVVMRLQWNMVSLPRVNDAWVFRKAERYRLLVVHFDLSYLLQWKGTHTRLDYFLKRSHTRSTALLYRTEYPLASVKMLAAIARITMAEGVYPNHVFREVRVLEVLYNIVEPLFREPPVRNRELSAPDLQKIRHAHAYIIDNLHEAITLHSLAQTLGLNVRKLKQGFRYVYGVTFYTLLTAERMEKASLLLEQALTVREICPRVGYKSSSHFSLAYRKYFGFPPERKRL